MLEAWMTIAERMQDTAIVLNELPPARSHCCLL
jgi:hypothetical protein